MEYYIFLKELTHRGISYFKGLTHWTSIFFQGFNTLEYSPQRIVPILISRCVCCRNWKD